jgi:two-component system response regulator
MSKKNILLIEDNQDDEALTLRALGKNNLAEHVTVMRDGAEALEYLLGKGSASRPLPDVIFLDLKLPKIDGLEVLQKLRDNQRTRLLPIVVLTSSDIEDDINRAYHLGCNSFIQKPIDFHKFTKEIGQLGMYWLHLNISPIDSTETASDDTDKK